MMWDGIIIGGGLAGLVAGIRAQERGKQVLLISEGAGSLTFAAGVLDFGRMEELQAQENHPYALLGEQAVRDAFRYLIGLCPVYHGEWGRPQAVLTPLGMLRQADLVPFRLDASPLAGAREIILMAPEGLKDFFPEVVKTNLQKQFPGAAVRLQRLRVEEFTNWHRVGKPVPATVYAKFWCTRQGALTLQNLLQETALEVRSGLNPVMVIPGLSSAFCPGLAQTLDKAPWPVVEVTSFPPSPAGQGLYETLKEEFRALGGELLIGSGVGRVEIESQAVRRVIVKSRGKETAFAARAFVLATGGLFGRGITVSPTEVREAVFGLPLYVPAEWSGSAFLGEQPYARTGIAVDDRLRPRHPISRELLLTNVHVAGRMLAHWDPWLERCGGGVSLASGFLAGELL